MSTPEHDDEMRVTYERIRESEQDVGSESTEKLKRQLALGQTLRQTGDHLESIKVLSGLLPIAERIWGESAWDSLKVRWALGRTLSESGNHEEARVIRTDLLRIMKERGDDPLSELMDAARWNLAFDLRILRDSPDLRRDPRRVKIIEATLNELEDEIVATRAARFGDAHPETVQAMELSAWTKERSRDFDAADALSQRICAGQQVLYGPESREVLEAQANLATVKAALGDFYDAKVLLTEAADVASRKLSRRDPLRKMIEGNVVAVDQAMVAPGIPNVILQPRSIEGEQDPAN